MTIEPSEYKMPEKILVLSDIEGNFEALRKLLQVNRVIDGDFNWTFKKGHLVFAGDMFDRGDQVTECLWLIYSLEEQAKAAGGYVHFILGNHEIMNLSGDIRYVREKYRINARIMGIEYGRLYDENSELGKWLRTKNIIEKIGDILFVHGGIDRKINTLDVTPEKINRIARPYYDKSEVARRSGDSLVSFLYDSKREFSPFWNRTFYLNRDVKWYTNGDIYYKASLNSLDSSLQKFNVNRIITGHTIVADTISVHYDGKVINTDTRHADGKSEALLIEGLNYFRVNAIGEKRLLFVATKQGNTPAFINTYELK